MLTFSAISRRSTARPYAASVRSICERCDSGATMLPETSTRMTVCPARRSVPSSERNMARSRASSHCGESLRDLRGGRTPSVGPVDGDELGELVGTLDDADEGLGHESAVGRVTSHLAHQKQRCVTKLHRGAGLDGEGRDLFCGDLRHEFADAPRDGYAVFVEFVLPEHAGENRAS